MSWKETDVLQLWKNSTVVPLKSDNVKENDDFVEKTSVTQRLSGTRSRLWTSFMEMKPEDRKSYLQTLIYSWPFAWERRAVTMPIHLNNFATAISTSLITTKINADIHLCNQNVRFFDSLKSCTKIPIFLGVYTTGMMNFLLNNYFVYQPVVEAEGKPCASCILQRSVAISLFTGVLFPVISSPHLSYHVQLLRQPKAPGVAHHIDLITLSYEYSRSVWRQLPFHVVGQVIAAALTSYTLLWGRTRIFDTIDVDPDYIKECMERELSNQKGHYLNRFKNWLSGFAFVHKNVDKGPIGSSEEMEKRWRI